MRLHKKRLSKWECVVCHWRGEDDKTLVAKSPFRDDDILIACPKCRLTDGFTEACDIEGCWKEATVGTIMKEGLVTFSGDDESDDYLRTCFEHSPKLGEDEK